MQPHVLIFDVICNFLVTKTAAELDWLKAKPRYSIRRIERSRYILFLEQLDQTAWSWIEKNVSPNAYDVLDNYQFDVVADFEFLLFIFQRSSAQRIGNIDLAVGPGIWPLRMEGMQWL